MNHMKTIIYGFVFILFCSISSEAQDYWTRLNGPFGGNIIEMKKSQAGGIYALRGEALYFSNDNADTWNKVTQLSGNTNLSMDISATGTVYVGKSSGGIWWSHNEGQSWSFNPVSVAPHSGLWASVIVVKVNPLGHVFINNHFSVNGGTTFTRFEIINSSILATDYAFNSANHVYAASNQGLFYSVDNCVTWEVMNCLPTSSLMFDNEKLVVAHPGMGVYSTTDNGANWEMLNNGLNDLSVCKLYKDQSNNYYAGTQEGKLFMSVNGGQSWSEIYSGHHPGKVNAILKKDNDLFFSSYFNGILRSSDSGNTWAEKNHNLYQMTGNSVIHSGSEIFTNSGADIYYSSNNGNSWEKKNTAMPYAAITSLHKNANGDLFAGLADHGIYRSSDNGNTWSSINNGLNSYGRFIYIQSNGNYLYAAKIFTSVADTLRIYRSSDNGNTWSFIYQPAEFGLEHFTVSSTGMIYVAGSNMLMESVVIRSSDNGNSWITSKASGFILMESFVSHEDELFMTASSKVYKSEDFGETWTALPSGPWGTAPISDLCVNNLCNVFIYANGMFFRTDDYGINWITLGSGLPSQISMKDLVMTDNGYLFGLTYYDGIFKSINTTVTNALNNQVTIAEGYQLSQNYPNPFNPSTVINYRTGTHGLVTLKVYDVAGKVASVLINEIQNPGEHSVSFSASGLAAGVYFYKIETGNFSDVKRMILLK